MRRVATSKQSTGSGVPKRESGRSITSVSIPLLTALLGIVVGSLLAGSFGDSEESEPAPAASSETDSESLQGRPDRGRDDPDLVAVTRALENERRMRRALESEVEDLKAALAREAPGDDAPRIPEVSDTPPGRTRTTLRQDQPWFDRSLLEHAGLSSSEIIEIEGRFEEFELEKLYFVDQSKRDGSFRTADYNKALTEMGIELREDLGPSGYDAYLYATGRDNRVIVRQVLDSSPAGYAGIEADDVVVRYAGERVFHPGEFKSATTEGEVGAPVSLEVLRDGERFRFSVPRGPLGIRMGRTRQPPLRNP